MKVIKYPNEEEADIALADGEPLLILVSTHSNFL